MKLLSIFLILSLVLCPVIGADTVFSGPVGLKNLSVSSSATSIGTDYTQDANCVGAWYMNSATGASEIDRSGNSADLTDHATVATSTDIPTGYSGNSKLFTDGNSEFLDMADGGSTDINGVGATITIACWVRNDNPGTFDTLVAKYAFSLSRKQYRLGLQSDNTVELIISNDGSTSNTATSTTTITSGIHHVAGVYDGSFLRMYVDGLPDGTPVAYSSGIYNGSSVFAIGANENGTANYHDGIIDEVIIFDRALSASEILELKTNGIDGTKGAND